MVNIDEHWVELADPSNHDALSNSHRTAVVSIKIQLYLCKTATLKKQKIDFQDRLTLNAGQKYCRILQWVMKWWISKQKRRFH